jgi:lincosamide nucleotidyltransferase A/C/D/E
MTPVEVIDVYTSLENFGVEIWIDGGWGVDALLGEQTRPHKDLDIAIQQKDVVALREFLHAQSYREISSKTPDLGILSWVMKMAEKLMSMSSD